MITQQKRRIPRCLSTLEMDIFVRADAFARHARERILGEPEIARLLAAAVRVRRLAR